MIKKPFLFTPGPTPLPDRIREVLARPLINHRSDAFRNVLKETRELCELVFETKDPILFLTASGTGAMEAAMTNLFQAGDRIAAVNGGKFGERFVKVGRTFGLEVDEITVPWGKAVTLEAVEAALRKAPLALCVQASETSTGTLHPIEEISALIRQKFPNILLIVDGITSVGALRLPVDELKIDVMIAASQKAFMTPPVLAVLSLSAKAQERIQNNPTPRFYFDLKRELSQISKNESAFTPAISLVLAFREALLMIKEEGLAQVYERHALLAKASRASLSALGLTLASERPGVACTAAFLSKDIDGKDFLKSIRERTGFSIAGGQDQWEGKALRLSHLGFYTAFDVMNAVVAIGTELERRKHLSKGALGEAIEIFVKEAQV